MNSNKPKQLDLKKKTQLIISAYLVLAALAVYFVIIPTAQSIKSIKADIFTQKVEQEKNLNRERNYASMGAKIKEIEPQLELLDSACISANRKLEFITTLEGAAAASGVEQKLNLDLKFNSDGNIKKVPLIIEVSGSYNGLMAYLTAIETISYYININAFDLNLYAPAKEDGDVDRYSLRLSANTYWQ